MKHKNYFMKLRNHVMKKCFETGLMILSTAGFFGFIYPELCLTEDTVKVIETGIETRTGTTQTNDFKTDDLKDDKLKDDKLKDDDLKDNDLKNYDLKLKNDNLKNDDLENYDLKNNTLRAEDLEKISAIYNSKYAVNPGQIRIRSRIWEVVKRKING